MKPNIDDEIRTFSYGELLNEIEERLIDLGRNTIARKDVIIILQCVFGFEDGRSHRNKINMCVARGYLQPVNKASYRMTDKGYAAIRMAKGIPLEANTGDTIADESTGTEVYDAIEPVIADDVNGYLNALRRGGQ